MGLDSSFVVVDEVWRSFSNCEVVGLEGYSVGVGELGEEGWDGAREVVLGKIQAGEGGKVAEPGRQFSAYTVVVEGQDGEGLECPDLRRYGTR